MKFKRWDSHASIYIYQINMYFVRHLNPTIPLQQRLTLLLPVTWACRPDLIPRDPVRWGSTHKQKPRLWTLPARLGPVTVHPIYPLARWSSCLVSLYLRVLRIFRFCGDCKELRGARTRIDRDWWNTHWNARPKECSTPSANSWRPYTSVNVLLTFPANNPTSGESQSI